MKALIDGFLKFQNEAFPQRSELFKHLATTQQPGTLFITCSDSRVVPELLTQQEPGELFVIRNAGNIVPSYSPHPGGVSATVEYAVAVLGVSDIVICGHSDCGAMRAVLNPDSLEKMPTVKAWLRHAEVAKTMVHDNCNCTDEKDSMPILTEENVIAQLQHLRTHPSVASRMANGHLFIHGWVYNIETSEIKAYDADQGRFLPLDGSHPIPVATPKARF